MQTKRRSVRSKYRPRRKAEQPKRRMLALVYDKLGIMGKAESCAREVRCPAPGVALPRS